MFEEFFLNKKIFATAGLVASILVLISTDYGRAGNRLFNPSNNNAMTHKARQKCVSCHIGNDALPEASHQEHDLAELIKNENCKECHSTFHNNTTGSNPASHSTPSKAFNKVDPSKHSPASPPEGMVYIPAGEFIMGSDNRMPDEKPEHVSHTGAYFIDINETTNAQYLAFVLATNSRLPKLLETGNIPFGLEDHPATFVTWYDAQFYCASRGKRLPTEKEWEKAARGTEGNLFPWGNKFDPRNGNVPDLGIGGTTPVGRFPTGKSPYGLNDMSGNVWEWVNAVYLPHPGNKVPNENYGERFNLLKGGSWVDCNFYKCGISAPTFNRSFFVPETRNKGFGFRCTMDAPSIQNQAEETNNQTVISTDEK